MKDKKSKNEAMYWIVLTCSFGPELAEAFVPASLGRAATEGFVNINHGVVTLTPKGEIVAKRMRQSQDTD